MGVVECATSSMCSQGNKEIALCPRSAWGNTSWGQKQFSLWLTLHRVCTAVGHAGGAGGAVAKCVYRARVLGSMGGMQQCGRLHEFHRLMSPSVYLHGIAAFNSWICTWAILLCGFRGMGDGPQPGKPLPCNKPCGHANDFMIRTWKVWCLHKIATHYRDDKEAMMFEQVSCLLRPATPLSEALSLIRGAGKRPPGQRAAPPLLAAQCRNKNCKVQALCTGSCCMKASTVASPWRNSSMC